MKVSTSRTGHAEAKLDAPEAKRSGLDVVDVDDALLEVALGVHSRLGRVGGGRPPGGTGARSALGEHAVDLLEREALGLRKLRTGELLLLLSMVPVDNYLRHKEVRIDTNKNKSVHETGDTRRETA